MNLKAYPCEGGGRLITDLSVLPTCLLTKLKSEDGLWQFREDRAFIGKPYIYSPASRRVEEITHTPTGTTRKCEIVLVWDDAGYFCMMPTECLEFPVPAFKS